MKYFILVLLTIILVSCSNGTKEQSDNVTSNQIPYQLEISRYFGKGHKHMHDSWRSGVRSYEEYQRFIKAKTDQYNRLIQQTDLTLYNVYAAGLWEWDDFILRETSKEDRIKCMRILSAAISENRVSYNAGRLDSLVYGVIITISQVIDENGHLVENEGGRLIRLFVPNLFPKTVKESFETDVE